MSIKIITEVWDHAEVSQGTLLVLLALADSADETSRECWPSVATLARRARLKERQVQSVLRDMEARGIITIQINAGRGGSNLYRIKKVAEWGGAIIAGGAAHCTGGVQPTAPGGVQPTAPEPSYRTVNEPSLFPPSQENPSSEKTQDSQFFDEFWNLYPRKLEKKAARAKFDAAVKAGADPAKIVDGVKRYVQWLKAAKPGEFRPEPKHPTTWLNKGCWEDELPGVPASTPSGADPKVLEKIAMLERMGEIAAADKLRRQMRGVA